MKTLITSLMLMCWCDAPVEEAPCGEAPQECCAVDAGPGECFSPDLCGYDGERWRCLAPEELEGP